MPSRGSHSTTRNAEGASTQRTSSKQPYRDLPRLRAFSSANLASSRSLRAGGAPLLRICASWSSSRKSPSLHRAHNGLAAIYNYYTTLVLKSQSNRHVQGRGRGSGSGVTVSGGASHSRRNQVTLSQAHQARQSHTFHTARRAKCAAKAACARS